MRIPFCGVISVNVMFDSEANVFIAETDDFMPQFGCVVEAETWEELERKLLFALSEAFEEVLNKPSENRVLKPA